VGISGAPQGVGFLPVNFADRIALEEIPGSEVETGTRVKAGAGTYRGCGAPDCTVCRDLEQVQEPYFKATPPKASERWSSKVSRAAESRARQMASIEARTIERWEVYPVSWAWSNPVVQLDFKVEC